jgi:hypothetical protein
MRQHWTFFQHVMGTGKGVDLTVTINLPLL